MSKCVNCGSEILTGDIHWEMGLCNNCYNELYKDHKTHISLDKMWLKLAQSFRDENEKLQDKVADLEAKLAESEADKKALISDYESRITKHQELMSWLEHNNEELKQQLAESEKQIKDAREAGNMAVDSWCKNRRKYEAQIAEMQNKSFILYSMLYETLEKQGCDNVASQIDQMTGWTYDKEADWLKRNRNYDQLKQKLAEKDKEIEELKTRLNDCQVYHLQNNSNETLIHNLKSELAELKQKAIMPKFVVGQEIWDKYLMAWKIKRVETHQFDKGNGNTAIIEIYRLGHDGNDDYSCCIIPDDNDVFFATKEEAEQKLAEIKGE